MEKRFEQNLNKPPFTEEDAEKLLKAAIGEDIFEGKEETPKDYRPYVYKEIDRLGEELVAAKKAFREAGGREEKVKWLKKINFFREEREKAKATRDRIKAETLAKENRGLDKDRLAA